MLKWLALGTSFFSTAQTQWAPTLTAHDPSPPLSLESDAGTPFLFQPILAFESLQGVRPATVTPFESAQAVAFARVEPWEALGQFQSSVIGTLLSDSFSRVVASGAGTAEAGSDAAKAWTRIEGQDADVSVDGSALVMNDNTGAWQARIGTDTTGNVEAYTEVSNFGTANAVFKAFSLCLRHQGFNDNYRLEWLNDQDTSDTGKLRIIRVSGGVTTNLSGNLTQARNTAFKMRARVETTADSVVLRLRYWTGATEPSTWNRTATDTDAGRHLTGNFGLRLINASTTDMQVDNFVVQSLATATTHWESLVGVRTSAPAPWESQGRFVSATLRPYESIGVAQFQRLVAWESRALFAASLTESWESAAGLVASAVPGWESLGRFAANRVGSWESLQGVAFTRGPGWESRLGVLNQRAAPYESVGRLLSSVVPGWESLQGLVNPRTGAWESRLGLFNQRVLSWESVEPELLRVTAILAWESLVGLNNQRAPAWEASGRFVSAVPRQWESLLAYAGPVVIPYESLQVFQRQQVAAFESLLGVRFGRDLPWESEFGGILIRLRMRVTSGPLWLMVSTSRSAVAMRPGSRPLFDLLASSGAAYGMRATSYPLLVMDREEVGV